MSQISASFRQKKKWLTSLQIFSRSKAWVSSARNISALMLNFILVKKKYLWVRLAWDELEISVSVNQSAILFSEYVRFWRHGALQDVPSQPPLNNSALGSSPAELEILFSIDPAAALRLVRTYVWLDTGNMAQRLALPGEVQILNKVSDLKHLLSLCRPRETMILQTAAGNLIFRVQPPPPPVHWLYSDFTWMLNKFGWSSKLSLNRFLWTDAIIHAKYIYFNRVYSDENQRK